MRFIPLLLCLFSCSSTPQLTELDFRESDGSLTLFWQNRPVLSYQVSVASPPEGNPACYERSGFFHPVYTPSGQIVTDGFPEGHMHQHGWFYAFTKTTYRDSMIDFWNQAKLLGNVQLRSLDSTSVRGNRADLYATLDHVSTSFGPILEEQIHVTVIPGASFHQVMWKSTVVNRSVDTLFVEDYLYGGLGMRGAASWNDADTVHFLDTARFLTSQGLSRKEANHSRPLWATMFGTFESGTGGFAAFDHPDNFQSPQPIRVHPEMPYFCMAPMVGHPFFLAPNEPLQLQYLLITFDGEPDVAVLDSLAVEVGKTKDE
ncbi:MAG: PmoA family protein [Bacteroidia bacterium]|nr:PmoA family protein [Bacteroidia bacterium]